MENKWIELRKRTAYKGNLVHSITSPIAINDCANAVLALGAKPIMAEHPREVAEITAIAKALTVSYANITDARMESIRLSGKTARELAIPCVVDAVGVTCSRMRMEEVKEFVKEVKPTVIKGNVSEIKALAGASFENTGIDVSEQDAVGGGNETALAELAQVIRDYANRTDSIVLATGEVDIISDGKQCCFVKNGSPNMAKLTGTGCILNCIIGVYLSACDSSRTDYFAATVLSVVTMGIAGESADAQKGLGTYHVDFINQLSLMTDNQILTNAKYSLK